MSPTRDHPRACGEHVQAILTTTDFWGSSPRLRGTRGAAFPQWIPAGIIPALAGNTRRTPPSNGCPRDHPRACGEHHVLVPACTRVQGSSPRLRGTLRHHVEYELDFGIIPALAGNTEKVLYVPLFIWDHPRACGEHIRPCEGTPFLAGSSPRLRGTRHRCEPSAGIIPALAGNTRLSMVTCPLPWDHPRACGEHRVAGRPASGR